MSGITHNSSVFHTDLFVWSQGIIEIALHAVVNLLLSRRLQYCIHLCIWINKIEKLMCWWLMGLTWFDIFSCQDGISACRHCNCDALQAGLNGTSNKLRFDFSKSQTLLLYYKGSLVEIDWQRLYYLQRRTRVRCIQSWTFFTVCR